jgi:hypothetical protein
MKLLALKIICPVCGSESVTYTCEPKCCFNHICDSCYTTFELTTDIAGGELNIGDFQPEERDSLAPTVACARCEGLDVYSLEDNNTLVCVSCHALLSLAFNSVKSR